jgi:hypothetical protein
MILSQKGNKPWGDNSTFFAFIFWGEGVDKSVSAFINVVYPCKILCK